MNSNQLSGHGGWRPGAGRPKGRETTAFLEFKKFLQEWFLSPEGRAFVLEKLQGSDKILINCLDRIFGKPSEVKDDGESEEVSRFNSFAHLTDEQLEEIIYMGGGDSYLPTIAPIVEVVTDKNHPDRSDIP